MTAPVNVPAGGKFAGKAEPHGGGKPPPYDLTGICNLPFLFAICGRSLRPPAKAGGVLEREPG